MSTLGTIVATDTNTGLKVIFHVAVEDIGVTFRRPEVDDWYHPCHGAMNKTTDGFTRELRNVENGRFSDAEFHEKKAF